MTYKEFIGKIQYDDESKIFHGGVIGLNEVITFQGRSIEELERAFAASVEDYLALDSTETSPKPEEASRLD
jgi:predicted HicB family RNase H-like nuclease